MRFKENRRSVTVDRGMCSGNDHRFSRNQPPRLDGDWSVRLCRNGEPAEKKEVMAAQFTAARLKEPLQRLFEAIAHVYGSELDRAAVRTLRGVAKHNLVTSEQTTKLLPR